MVANQPKKEPFGGHRRCPKPVSRWMHNLSRLCDGMLTFSAFFGLLSFDLPRGLSFLKTHRVPLD